MKIFKTAARLLVLAALAAALCSCDLLDGLEDGYNKLTYDYWEKYTSGGARLSEQVTKLDVQWIAGSVNVAYSEDGELSLSETSVSELNESEQLRWWLDGTTLRVKFAKYGFDTSLNLQKDLTITLPKGAEFEEIDINNVSASVKTAGLICGRLELVTVSGAMEISDASVSGKISVSSVSGDFSGTFISAVDKLSVNSVSGSVSVEALSIEKFNAETVSGIIEVMAAEYIGAFEASATSGDVTLAVPATTGFKASFVTVSGEFSSDIPTTQSSGVYTAGDGGYEYSANTVSGNFSVKKG